MTFFEKLQQETETDRRTLVGVRIIEEALRGRIRLPQYVAFLTQAYYHVRHTVPLLMACGSRLPERLHWLQGAIAEYISEETGHDEWVLADLAACGADGQRVRSGTPLMETDL